MLAETSPDSHGSLWAVVLLQPLSMMMG
jgi:hypothetical protein